MYLIEKAPAEVFFEDRTTYPFENMNVGDSFLITDFKKAESARVSAIQFCKRKCKDWKFTQRKMDGGWRIIRIGWILRIYSLCLQIHLDPFNLTP